MAGKNDFTAGEWQLLLESAMMAGIAVTAAEPSGLWGSLKEGTAAASALRAGKAGPNALIAALAADLETPQGQQAVHDRLAERFTSNQPAGIKAQAIEALREAAMLLDGKAATDSQVAEDSEAFKQWLQQIAWQAAQASKEGRFLWFGGVPVSESEKATLAEIAAALGTELRDPPPAAHG